MSAPFISLALASVPNVPGVPTLFAPGAPLGAVVAATASLVGILSAPGLAPWGIFGPGGAPILPADSVGSVEYQQDYQISDYPQEQGAFASYNKVQVPYQAKVTYLLNQDRAEFLNVIGQQLASLSLVTVTTPEVSYANANLTHYGYRRTSRAGVTLIEVEVWCEEVRLAVAATGTTGAIGQNTQSPNGASPTDGGAVTPGDTTSSPTNPVTGQLTSNLPNPSGVTPSTSLPTPNIGPAFYNADNLPQVPNSVSTLNSAQQDSVLSFGRAVNADYAQVVTAPIQTTTGSLPAVQNVQTVSYGISAP